MHISDEKKINLKDVFTELFLFFKKTSKHTFHFGSSVSHNCKAASMV